MKKNKYKKHHPILPILFGILLIFGTNKNAVAEVTQKKTNPLVISVKRDTHFMNDPAYKIEIYENGDVVYSGIRGVKTRGKVELKISQEAIKKLLEDIEASGFFCIKKPEEPVPKGLIVAVRFNGKYKELKYKGYHMRGLRNVRMMVEEAIKVK